MTKHFCDFCGNEIPVENRGYALKFPVHVSSPKITSGHVKNIGGAMVPVSGREESFDACAICFNAVMYAAWDAAKKLKKKDV